VEPARTCITPTTATSITIRNVLVLLLACVAGVVDAVSYMRLGHVFTANMTGNTVLLGLALGQEESPAVIRSSMALVGFLGGASLGAWVTSRGQHGGVWAPAVTVTLAMEGALLTVLGVVWYEASDLDDNQATRVALITLLALAMGLQSAVGRRLNIPGIATTYITGTLVSLSTRLITGRRGAPAFYGSPVQAVPSAAAAPLEPSLGLLASTWGIYIGGAAAAASMITFFGPFFALALPIALLVAVILTAVGDFRQ
jgi:uncharacterized membrane protein YoaK (UPF0700 family)